MSKEITSKELMESAGNVSRNTLTQWYKCKLIPPPEVRAHPSGRGKTNYWPWWVAHRCKRIKKLSDEGRSRAEILALIGSNWEFEEEQAKLEKKRERRSFAKICQDTERINAITEIRERINDEILDWSRRLGREARDVTTQTFEPNMINRCLEMINEGFRPVLVLHDEGVALTSDVAVAHQITNLTSPNESILVIPLSRTIARLLDEAAVAFSRAQICLPGTVRDIGGEKIVERDFKLVGEWGFEVGP
ncbi:hypothetical protein [Rosistilla oblonga]|uniref:hypothetical protein n=1 Tax=Rosistilla oblonga TaxID=2527990 RepID=UPI003A970CEF